MKAFWGILFFAVLVACSPSSVSITPTATANHIPTDTSVVSSNPTAEIISSQSVSSTAGITTYISVTPRVESIAPIHREVKLSELGLSRTTRLIVYYQPNESLQILSAQNIQPQEIPINADAKEWLFTGIDISPNQNWFIYKVPKGMKDDIAYFDYWLSSIDGKEQKIALSDVQGGTELRWVTDEQIELWYHPDGLRACPKRETVMYPFTQETRVPPELPHSIKPHCFFDLNMSPDRSKMVYLNEDGFWSIYDFNTNQSQNVFSWLSKTERFDLWPQYIQWSQSGITFVLPGPESIDFIIDLPVLEMKKSNVVLNRVLLPDEEKLYNETFSWWALEKGFVGFDLIDAAYDYSGSEQGSPSSNFVIFDFKNSVWHDYNLDRAKTGESQKVLSSFVFSSADKRFLAWTIYEPPDMGRASQTVILDRETGRIARIPSFEFLGWGEMNQP